MGYKRLNVFNKIKQHFLDSAQKINFNQQTMGKALLYFITGLLAIEIPFILEHSRKVEASNNEIPDQKER